MGALRPWHIIVLVAVLVLLFGAKRLPGAARSLGRSMRIMKAETKGLVDEPEPDDLDEKADAQAGRRPLDKDQDAPAAGEVVDPPERPRKRRDRRDA
ncbi:MAG: Sec-independent protein translocase subunit TatA [Micromonosporaceae bacterium]|nr:Sec-independent protein translocase subunit TatA [Micromonosporaceae bacterium]